MGLWNSYPPHPMQEVLPSRNLLGVLLGDLRLDEAPELG